MQEPNFKLSPPPLQSNALLQFNNVESNEIQRPPQTFHKPHKQNHQHKPQIVKLKPIKMISQPHIHFAHPPQGNLISNPVKQNFNPFGKPQSLVTKLPLKFHQSNVQAPIQNTITGFHPPIQNQSFKTQGNKNVGPVPHAVFFSNRPTNVGNAISPLHPAVVTQPFVDVLKSPVVSKVPNVNAGVLPLANEIDESPNLRFPPFVK